MDKLTESVRAFYEAYPYPPGEGVDCDGYQARLLLSYLERPVPLPDRPRVLEAGCGRGLNLRAAAALQPDIDFTGIDINRVAIREAQDWVAERGLCNLRFECADLLDPGPLPGGEGSYDLILSYGVIHHLSDPLAGLERLRKLLVPQGGVLAMMVDGCYGRQPLDRFQEALAIIEAPQRPVQARLESARALARVAEESLFKGNCWQGSSRVAEVEFVDRCLHVHEHSYDIEELWRLLEAAGLCFVRWLEPAEWSVEGLIGDESLRRGMPRLDALQRYRLIERLFYRPKLTLVAARAESRARSSLEREVVARQWFRLNPQLKSLPEAEGGGYRLRRQPPYRPGTSLEARLLALAGALARDFRGEEMAATLAVAERDTDELYSLLWELERRELLYRPPVSSSPGSA